MNRLWNKTLHLFLPSLGLLTVSLACAACPVEDMAEKGKRIADEKVPFFYDFPELVAFQQQVIASLCSYGQ